MFKSFYYLLLAIILILFGLSHIVIAQPKGISTYSGDAYLDTVGKNDDNDDDEDEDEEDEEFYNWQRCLRCHNFTDAELLGQIKRARNRHIKQKKDNSPCSECHDQEEVVGICCHATYPRQ